MRLSRGAICCLLIVVGLLQVGPRANAQSNGFIEPQALRLQFNRGYWGIRLEGEHDITRYASSKEDATYQRLYAGPVLGLDAVGSVYHPNLLRFTLSGEIWPAYGWNNANFTTSSGDAQHRESLLLGNFLTDFNFLSNKPYHFTLFLTESYSYRDYDFFNRVEVNTWRYGGNFGYQTGPVPWTLNLWRRSEDIYGQTTNSSYDETTLEFAAHNDRKRGSSYLNYSLNQYASRDGGGQPQDSNHSFGITDTETFGANNQFRFSNSAGYGTRDSVDNPSDDFNAISTLTVQHSPTLASDYNATYYRSSSSSPSGESTSENLYGAASITHQLYKSLNSTLRVFGQEYQGDGSYEDSIGSTQNSAASSNRFGIGLMEQYTKRLGSVGRLTMFGSFQLEHCNQDNSGSMLVINDERHAFATSSSISKDIDSDSFFLNQPFVDQTTIVVKDAVNPVLEYQEGRDYTVSSNGSLTMIRRNPTGTIAQTQPVTVDYRAQSTPSGEYDTTTTAFNARVDLWNGLVAVYTRYSSITNNGAPELLLQDMNLVATGMETNWRWLHAGVEYESHESNYSTYNNLRFFQTLTFKPTPASSMSLSFTEGHTDYLNPDRTEDYYSGMLRYQQGISRRLSFHMDAGAGARRGEGVDQTMAAIRPGLEFHIGRLEIRAGYSFEYGKYNNSDEHLKNRLFITGRRNF